MGRKLIVCIVPRGHGDAVTAAANSAGAGGGTVLPGRGAAPSTALHVLGFGERAKDVALIVVDDAAGAAVRAAVIAAATTGGRPRNGAVFSIAVGDFGKSGERGGNRTEGDSRMDGTGESQLITVIVNRGLAEDAMAAARKAGASGGTILEGAGTAKEDDAKFFGVSLVPEKEILLIHVEADKADAVFEAVRSVPRFDEKGVGVAFRTPARDFTTLGGKTARR